MKRIVLGESAGRDAIDAAMCANGWMLLDIHRQRESYELVYATRDGRHELRYVDDPRLHARFIVLPDDDELEREVRASLEVVADKSILESARSAPEPERIRALYRLALIARSDAMVPVLQKAAGDPSPHVRIAAIETAFRLSAPELDPILERAAAADLEPQIRAHAASLLRARRRAK